MNRYASVDRPRPHELLKGLADGRSTQTGSLFEIGLKKPLPGSQLKPKQLEIRRHGTLR